MRVDRLKVFTVVFVGLVVLASATQAFAASFTIGGTVSGLATGASVTLLDNGADSLTVTANGKFTFKTALATGATYAVTVGTQPTGATCTVTRGSGTVGTTNVTNIAVACKASTFTVGGTLSGLITGHSITLLDNGASTLKLTANGTFTFKTALLSGAAYAVTISVQPAGETCAVTSGSGTVGTSNVTSVKVACTPNTYTIGGTVSGLTTGKSVTLLDNGADSLTVKANGKFTFVTSVASGSPYKVTVSVQPTGETCTVTSGSGTVVAANIVAVKVACKPNTYAIGGTLSGLASGASVTLLDNGSDSLALTANGKFTFAKAVASGAAYKVTVSVQPTGAACTVTSGSGTVVASDVTTVVVTCKAKAFTVGGTVSGLTTGASVTLLNNGSNSLTVAANGKFTFTTALATGAAYDVTVGTQPTGETCTVTAGSGTVGSANVTTVKVACAAPKTFTIGGTVSGLSTGTSVTLLDNGADSLTVTANGTFTFKTALGTGAAYSVTVGTQPTGETCTVTNGTGTVGTAKVTNVKVACAGAKTFTIGGILSGLNSGAAITLLDNGTDSLTVTANGAFTFSTALATGATYNVTIKTQPTGETCSVTSGSGTVGTANVTSVKVACTTSKTFTIGGTVSGLNSGTSITLLDNGTDSLTVTANGSFTFATALATGATYNVTIKTQPTGETCTLSNASGTVGSANVTNVGVACKTNTFTIGGTVSGLSSGASVTLLDNGADSLTVSANGSFTFATALATGATYSVTVKTQPTGETCTVTNGSGTVGTANVTNVAVACAAVKTFTIGGTVSGLNSGTSVTLLDNGTDSLTVSANGSFTFATALATGATYNVTVKTQPTGETCTVTNGSGTVGSANVTNVAVACVAAKTFTIGGTLSGLTSGSVTLQDNGTDSLTRTANGAFTFATALATGATYNVTVSSQPTGETCGVTNGSGTVGTSNITNVAVTCTTNGGGGPNPFWIPYSATPVPQATPAGKNGLFLIPSDQLAKAPAPTFVTTDNTQLLGIGTQISVSGGVVTYYPQVMMYSDTDSTGTTRIFGLKLAGTTSVPTPTQISNTALPSGQQVCPISFSSLTDVSTPNTLFVVVEVGTSAQCAGGTGTFEVVHYLDSSTTAPSVVSINTTQIQSIYQNGKLAGLLLFDSATNSFNFYADNTFTSPVEKITGLSGVNYISGVLNATTLSTSGTFIQVTTTGSVNELYRFDGSTLVATLIQSLASGSISTAAQDDSNLYYLVLIPGTGTNETATFNQVALGGGTPKLLYTSPSFNSGAGTFVEGYQLIGSNDSVLVFEFYNDPYTNGIQDPTKATATIYTIPVGVSTTTPTTLANYTAGNELPMVFMAAPSGASYSSSVLFATVQNATGTPPLVTIAFSAVSMSPNGGAAPPPIANSVYAPLPTVSIHLLTDEVWQITGITDTNGGYGGGTANSVNVSTLADTPFTTVGGGNYVFSAGFIGDLFGISSNNVALGVLENAPAVIQGTGTIQEDGSAADLTSNFFYPISITNTFVLPY